MLVSRHGAGGCRLSTCRCWGIGRAVGATVISAHLTGPALPAADVEHGLSFGAGKLLVHVFREVSS
jgi:hypothetical protein